MKFLRKIMCCMMIFSMIFALMGCSNVKKTKAAETSKVEETFLVQPNSTLVCAYHQDYSYGEYYGYVENEVLKNYQDGKLPRFGAIKIESPYEEGKNWIIPVNKITIIKFYKDKATFQKDHPY